LLIPVADRTPFTGSFYLYRIIIFSAHLTHYVSVLLVYASMIYCSVYFPIADLVKLVEKTIRLEYERSPNRPIYLVGESLGGCLALAVTARNHDIDLVLILANPGNNLVFSDVIEIRFYCFYFFVVE